MAGDPFEPELAAAAAGDVRGGGDGRGRRAPAARPRPHRPTCRGASASGIRSSAARSTRRRPAAGGWAPTSGAPRRSRRAGRRRAARAHHVERSAREGDVDAVAVLREAGEAAARLAPASAAHWFADALRLLPATAPAEERVELLLARARRADRGRPLRRQPRRAARGARARRPTTRTRCAPGSPAPAPASRASSGGTSRPARASRAPSTSLPDQGSAEAVGADDRARRERSSAARSTRRCTSGPSARVSAARRLGDAP